MYCVSVFTKDALARVFKRYDEMLGQAFYRGSIRTAEDFLTVKNKQAKPGEAFVNMAATFEDFYDLTPGGIPEEEDRLIPFGEGYPERR